MTIDELGEQIRAARRTIGISQTELALRADVSRPTIARLETQRLSEIGYKSLRRILHSVGLDLRLTALNQSRPTLEDLARDNAG